MRILAFGAIVSSLIVILIYGYSISPGYYCDSQPAGHMSDQNAAQYTEPYREKAFQSTA